MRKAVLIAALLLCSFLGGAAAQIIGGGINVARAATAWLNLVGSLSGAQTPYSCLAGTCYDINFLNVTGDTQAAGQGGGGGPSVSGFTTTHTFGGGAATGNFVGTQTNLNQTATSGNTAGNYVGTLINTKINAGVSEGSSSLWALNGLATCQANSWLGCVGVEWDVAVPTSAAAVDKIGEQIVLTTIDRVAGSRVNIGFMLGNQDASSPGWDCGWCGGTFNGFWPFTASSTVMGCWAHGQARSGGSFAVPQSACGTAGFILDYSQATIAAGGAPIAMPLITPASSGTTCRQGSIEWDASFIYVCTSANTFKRVALSSF